MPHPLIYTAPYRLGPAVHDELFRRLVRSRDYLAAGLAQPLRLNDAAREACLSPYHYHRLFTRTFGESPLDFLTRLRMDEAKRLLAREQRAVTDVCYAVGYESLGSFSTRFRNLVGQSPSEYQRALRRVFPVPGLAVHRHVPACFLQFYGVKLF
ncbi:AraC family transcriptional regulator [uncultured Paludibaculum sp.]|uniref:helix-turn-helix transcriptional regulator n=1 Tax=uncultured Paludibaculum sp. TaxID=1765020 RepID=UPI002AAA8A93|nr:AraC family transcriptional regulator [uncultured Paludibaculum sp.]